MREGVKALVNIQPDMRIVGEAADGQEAVRLAKELEPDVVVLEISLGGVDGEMVTVSLRKNQKAVVLTAREEKTSVRRLLAAGAAGYVLKRAPADQLTQAIRTVAGGGIYLDPEIAGRAADDFISPETPEAALSARELQVMRLIAAGHGNKKVAAKFRLSVKSVETYKSRSMEKLKLRGRVDLIRHALKNGWLDEAAFDPPLGGDEFS